MTWQLRRRIGACYRVMVSIDTPTGPVVRRMTIAAMSLDEARERGSVLGSLLLGGQDVLVESVELVCPPHTHENEIKPRRFFGWKWLTAALLSLALAVPVAGRSTITRDGDTFTVDTNRTPTYVEVRCDGLHAFSKYQYTTTYSVAVQTAAGPCEASVVLVDRSRPFRVLASVDW